MIRYSARLISSSASIQLNTQNIHINIKVSNKPNNHSIIFTEYLKNPVDCQQSKHILQIYISNDQPQQDHNIDVNLKMGAEQNQSINITGILILIINYNIMRIAGFVFLFCLFTLGVAHRCIHHKLMEDFELHEDMVYDDTKGARQLQQATYDNIRIQLSFQLRGRSDIVGVLKNVTEIARTFFENTLKVQRDQRIFYPNQIKCNQMIVPINYNQPGTEADYVFIIGSSSGSSGSSSETLATCKHCALLKSNNRPIFGGLLYYFAPIISKFDNGIDRIEFQAFTNVAIHQMMHGLVFSGSLFDKFRSSDAEYRNNQSDPFITNGRIRSLTQEYFGCNQRIALGLQQDNGNSHWEEQFLGDQIMTPEIDENAYISELTMEVFAASGWYEVQREGYFEPSAWGKGKGCDFIRNRNNCSFEQFCQPNQDAKQQCDFHQAGKGFCRESQYMDCLRIQAQGLEKKQNCYVNFKKAKTGEIGSINSKCFESDIIKKGESNNKSKGRCYQTICLPNRKVILMRIDRIKRICRVPGQKLVVKDSFSGVINCPDDIQKVCNFNKQCAYSCNNQGICIDGQCLCKDSSGKTSTCRTNRLLQQTSEERQIRARQSMDCPLNTIFDPITKKCETCSEMLSCSSCDNEGCITCDDGSHPVRGRCY